MLKKNSFLIVRKNSYDAIQLMEMKGYLTLSLSLYLVFIWVTIFASVSQVIGQNQGNKNSPDMNLRSSGRVNPSTLGMEIDIPLGSYPGRGINVPINLSYSSKLWRLKYGGEHPTPGGNSPSGCRANYTAQFSEESAAGWTTSMAAPYIEYTGAQNTYNYNGEPNSGSDGDCFTLENPTPPGEYYVKKILIHLPSGETHELRMEDSPSSDGYPNPSTWNGVYYAVDGSNLKYIQDSSTNTYRLQMPDGSFYDFDQTVHSYYQRKAVKFTDRNGNFTTYYGPGSVDEHGVTHPNGYWKDTLGRNISVPIGLTAPSAPTTAQAPQIYSMPGMTGTYKLHWKRLNGGTQAESALTDISDPNYQLRYIGNTYLCTQNNIAMYCSYPQGSYLFSGGDSRIFAIGLFNPVVLHEIELPTGQKYKFTYDVYGRIEKIIYPTGGEEVFEYGLVIPLTKTDETDLNAKTNFGVKKRRVYQTAGQGMPYKWTYEAFYTEPYGYAVRVTNPDNTKSERFLHQGKNAGTDIAWFGYDNVLAGMPFEERGFDSAGNLVSRKLTSWTKNVYQVNPGGQVIAERHPRVRQEKSFIYDSNGNGVSTTVTYEYEGESNLNKESPVLLKKTTQYAFETVTDGNLMELSLTQCDPGDELCIPTTPTPTPEPTPSSPAIKIVENTYLINDANYSTTKSYYTAQNMMGLVTATVVKDGAGTVVSRSEMLYDEGSYPIISGGTISNWQDPNNTYRGNPTTSKVWDSTKGAVTNQNAYIATHAQFDNFGNQRKAWDAKGNLTETDYTSPLGQDYKFAFPTKVISTAPDPNGTHGSDTAFVTTATFDPTTGLPLTTTDTNGLETRIAYDPVTLRPLNTKTFYQNVQVGGMSETVYHDEPNNYWVKSRTLIDTGKWVETISYFDGLGRAYKAEEINSQGNIFVEKEFDEDGRVKRVTNPFRAGESKQWTTNVYDEASRIKEVILPDGARVKTDYGVSVSGILGVTKTITDQAGKKRRGISDALGRMVRVIEDPDGQNLSTDYVFDTLGNLRKTIQGEQSRYFTYDSLGRLLRAKQPEQEVNTNLALSNPDAITGHNQWSVGYEYDDNGNITKTTDANNTFVQGTYDKLNRLIFRNYSDSTPDVSFYYDGTGLNSVPARSKGKTTRVTSNVSETRYTSFDELGRLTASQQVTDGQTYGFGYQYNLTALVSETYPSGRIVTYEFNQDGDLSRVAGQTANNSKTYANSFNYNSAGAIESLRLGNGKWETAKYNERQQIIQIGLGNSSTDLSLLKLEYGYGNNVQNNGSLRSQKISFNGLAQPFEQTYAYDDLNRLLSAEEKVNNQTTWKQTFTYDRYGNRRFDTANTTTLAQSNDVTNPQIDTATNRFSAGQNYIYDKNGDLTQDAAGKHFLYDAENHQKEVKDVNNQTVATYQYDGEGRRIKKILINSGEETIFVYNASGQLAAEYVINPETQNQLPSTSYLTTDHLGSPRIITNENGNVTTRKDYMAFGEETSTPQRIESLGYAPANGIRQGYTGYEKDTESGLEFAQARYYNSAHGRFTSVDPLTASANLKNPQTFNRYSYVLNSPYKFTDPLGLISENTCACGNRCANSDPRNFGGGMASAYGGMEVQVLWRMDQQTVDAILAPPAPRAEQNEDDPITTVKITVNKKFWTTYTNGESSITEDVPEEVNNLLNHAASLIASNNANAMVAVKALRDNPIEEIGVTLSGSIEAGITSSKKATSIIPTSIQGGLEISAKYKTVDGILSALSQANDTIQMQLVNKLNTMESNVAWLSGAPVKLGDPKTATTDGYPNLASGLAADVRKLGNDAARELYEQTFPKRTLPHEFYIDQ